MEYLKNKLITLLLFVLPMVSYGQWSYTFTDPCTLNQQTIQMGSSNDIALNYFGNVQTFTQTDFTNGTFDSWLDLVTQANSGNPCQSVSQIITNNTSSVVVQNTITVVTSIMGVLGGDMIPQAISSSAVPVAESIDNSQGEEDSDNKSDKDESIDLGYDDDTSEVREDIKGAKIYDNSVDTHAVKADFSQSARCALLPVL